MRRILSACCLLMGIFFLVSPAMAAENRMDTSLLTVRNSVDPVERVYDYAGLLSAEEQSMLSDQAEAFVLKNGMDIAILTIRDSTVNTTARLHDYSNDFYTSNGLGKKNGGLLLLVNMDTRDLFLTAHGDAASTISQSDIDNILNAAAPYLSGKQYRQAFSRFIGESQSVLTGKFYFYLAVSLGGSLLLAVIIMVVISAVHSHGLRAAPAARAYLAQGGFRLTGQRDEFVTTRTNRVAIPKNTGGSGGSGSGGGGMRGGSRGGGRKF